MRQSTIVCVLFLTSHALAQIMTPPTDVAGRVGENVNITCGANLQPEPNGFEWTEFVTRSAGRRIFSIPAFDPIDDSRYAIHGEYNLEIKNVQWDQAGVYGCKMFSDPVHEGAHMFVFDQFTLMATRMVEGDMMNISCEARFGASRDLNENDIPRMTLMVNGQQQNTMTSYTARTDSEPYIMKGYAMYTARMQDSGEDFVCMLTTERPYNYEAMDSMVMDIHFGVQEPGIIPNQQGFYVGDVINCTAEGSPEPDYEWRAINSPAGSVTQEGQHLFVTEEMVNDLNNPDDKNRWECVATNTIGVGSGEMTEAKREIEFTVMSAVDTGGSKTAMAGWKIGLAVGIPVAVIVIAVAVVLGVMFAKKRKANGKANGKLPPPAFAADNRGAAFPGDADLSNGLKPTPIVSALPNPLPEDVPANRSRDSPGYADLGVKQISNSYPGVNVSMSSVDSFDDSVHQTPPPIPPTDQRRPPVNQREPPPPANQREPPSHVNPSYHSTTPPQQGRRPPASRPNYLNVGDEPVRPNHPDTFV